MNPNEIQIEFYAGEKSYAVGKKDAWLDILTDATGLAALGKIERCITPNRNNDLRLNEGWNNNEQGHVRDAIISLALSKFEIGAKEVSLTGEELKQAIKIGLEKHEASRKQTAENKERQDREQKQREDQAAAKQKAICDAKELLKDELSEKDKEITRLRTLANNLKAQADANEKTILEKYANAGSFDVEEEHTVTYKIVREDEE